MTFDDKKGAVSPSKSKKKSVSPYKSKKPNQSKTNKKTASLGMIIQVLANQKSAGPVEQMIAQLQEKSELGENQESSTKQEA